MKNSVQISIIIPFYNEEENIIFIFSEIISVMKQIDKNFEIIAINDASTDKTFSILNNLKESNNFVNLINNTTNLGQGTCFFQGFYAAKGEIIITLDGDGQNNFNDVPAMIEYLDKYDAVCGQRIKRKDPFSKKMTSKIGNSFRNFLLKDCLKDTSCSLKVFKRKIIPHLIPIKGSFRFFPFQMISAEFNIKTINVDHRHRTKGKSKYSILKLYFVPVIFDMLFFYWLRINRVQVNK